MNRTLKITFLIITLAVPLAIVLFLQMFGENKFSIPVYYEEGVADEVTNCNFEKRSFLVPDSLLTSTKGPSIVLFFKETDSYNAIALNNHVQRLKATFGKETPEMVFYASRKLVQHKDVVVRKLPQESLEHIMQCGFILKEFNRYILVDRKNRIRGYYGTALDEVDRLIVEIKILLENGVS